MNFDVAEKLIRRCANYVGIDIHRHRPATSRVAQLYRSIRKHRVNLVLDVGANTGQFALSLRHAGYQGRLVSFEPLLAAHAQLVKTCKNENLWNAYPRIAVGDHEGEIELNVSANSFSSSALDMLDRHESAAPGSKYVGSERVRLSRLDVLARDYLEPNTVPFVKIDTQGYEDRVLDGMAGILDIVRGVQIELSFVPLYEGQYLFDDLVERLRMQGFAIWAVWPGICAPDSGRMLQVDVVFFRE